MNKEKTQHIKAGLLPFSWFYGIGVSLRNKLFDANIFKSVKYTDVAVICVGNLTVGGTGKTPHIEYLIRLLQDEFKVAVVSRGYKRKSMGFILADEHSTSAKIGDEPFQIKQKFPTVQVAVDGNRRRGIEKLLELPEEKRPEVILMDDGFQHRWVKPSLSIVLCDASRPVYEDKLLPAGNLREPVSSLSRADIILSTKCPCDMKPIDIRIAANTFGLFPYQHLMFTSLEYEKLTLVVPQNTVKEIELTDLVGKHVLLVTGIASPKPLQRKLSDFASHITPLTFSDHHNFTEMEVENLVEQFMEMPEGKRVIVTTEKDSVRLASMRLPDEILPYFYYLPIEISFLIQSEKHQFDNIILKHVRKYSTNSRLHQR